MTNLLPQLSDQVIAAFAMGAGGLLLAAVLLVGSLFLEVAGDSGNMQSNGRAIGVMLMRMMALIVTVITVLLSVLMLG